MLNLDKNGYNRLLKIKTGSKLILFGALFWGLQGCESERVTYTPAGYDITKPVDVELGNKLREVSGICWINDSLMLANNDEAGKVFAINPRDMKDFDYRNIKFGEKNDYEDIVKVDAAIYVLISTGQIVEITNYQNEDSIQTSIVASLAGKNEFETMYYDPGANSLVLLCKSCHKEKDQVRTAFRFDLATRTLIDTPYYKIDIGEIRKRLDDSRAEFRPSAAAIHPLQNKLYIVSSIGKLLVITDTKGKVEQAIAISPTMFPQPEGLTFAANGDMYISNEAATDERATLLKFLYKKQ